jgi:hypothetical protein
LRMAALLLAALFLYPMAYFGQEGPRIAQPDIKALIQAIQDEIYDEGCQGYGFDASRHHGDNSYDLPLYVKPTFNSEKLYWAIYKLLPIGEVLREFAIGGDGLAAVSGHPQWRFPSTDPSYLTVYMDDDQLSQFKHDWMRTSFTLERSPSAQRLREARERQKKRFGSSYVIHKRDCSFSWRRP